MRVSEVQITPVKPFEGLVAFASCVIDGQLFIGSIGVHKRLDGTGYRITYPTKTIAGKQLHYYHPVSKATGLAIEQAVVSRCKELFERSDENYGRHNQTTSDD